MTPSPSLAAAMAEQFKGGSPHEQVLALQLTWAIGQLQRLLANATPEPTANWLRLFSLADRIYQRNFKALERLRKPATPPPARVQQVAAAFAPPAPAPPRPAPPAPQPSSRPAVSATRRITSPPPRRVRQLDRLLDAPPPFPLDITITPPANRPAPVLASASG